MATGIPCHKVILCGEYGSGKSCIFRRFVDNSFTTDTGPKSTIGLDHFTKNFKQCGREIKIQLWDTAGIERFATLAASYFQSAGASILCYSLNNRESFNILSQHILDIVMHSSTAKIFLCGTKKDLVDANEITDSDISDFRLQCDAVLSGTFKVSCKTGEGVKEMFDQVAKVLVMEGEHKFDPTRIQPMKEEPSDSPKQKRCCSS